MYPEFFVAPMREELTNLGFEELQQYVTVVVAAVCVVFFFFYALLLARIHIV